MERVIRSCGDDKGIKTKDEMKKEEEMKKRKANNQKSDPICTKRS